MGQTDGFTNTLKYATGRDEMLAGFNTGQLPQTYTASPGTLSSSEARGAAPYATSQNWLRSNARIADNQSGERDIEGAALNLQRNVGADLTWSKNFEGNTLKQMMNLPGADEGKKVFYNTSGL